MFIAAPARRAGRSRSSTNIVVGRPSAREQHESSLAPPRLLILPRAASTRRSRLHAPRARGTASARENGGLQRHRRRQSRPAHRQPAARAHPQITASPWRKRPARTPNSSAWPIRVPEIQQLAAAPSSRIRRGPRVLHFAKAPARTTRAVSAESPFISASQFFVIRFHTATRVEDRIRTSKPRANPDTALCAAASS